jgi:hypothetical protein
MHSSVFHEQSGKVSTCTVPAQGTEGVAPYSSMSFSWEQDSSQLKLSSPVGLTLLFGKIMTILSSLMDAQGQSSADGIKFALSLVNIALEAGGPVLCFILCSIHRAYFYLSLLTCFCLARFLEWSHPL